MKYDDTTWQIELQWWMTKSQVSFQALKDKKQTNIQTNGCVLQHALMKDINVPIICNKRIETHFAGSSTWNQKQENKKIWKYGNS